LWATSVSGNGCPGHKESTFNLPFPAFLLGEDVLLIMTERRKRTDIDIVWSETHLHYSIKGYNER
jgi:hypothetical protein